ncbi:hypothetical protein ALC53_05997 [Atta colombica]|uniref:Uncharacterized protein n=1 Tax=Atta colombica TaxID=520822 RepID=A0A195BG77_9HYME|nr:hypothetical protein ALC53_05997 [Atta colombica]
MAETAKKDSSTRLTVTEVFKIKGRCQLGGKKRIARLDDPFFFDADGRLLVTCVRALSDPNARGLIAANTGPPYLSLSSPLPSGIVMHFD